MSGRYAQCDDTCTVDCGHCKGAGRPVPEFTSEQILDGIAKAIGERNFDAAIALTRLLAVQDPQAAQSIVDVVTLAASGAVR